MWWSSAATFAPALRSTSRKVLGENVFHSGSVLRRFGQSAKVRRAVGARHMIDGTTPLPQRPLVSSATTRALSSTIAIDDNSLRAMYDRDGFVVVPGLHKRSEVAELLDEMVQICRGRRAEIPGLVTGTDELSDEDVIKRYLCIHFPHKVSDKIRQLVKNQATVDVLVQCIGPNVKCMQTMMFMKGPGHKGQACHQDEYYIPTRDRSLCASWIALDDATVDNGCLWVIPGSHKHGIIWPMKEHNDQRFDASNETYGYPYQEEDWVPVELKSGDALFFNGYLLHRSLDNRSNRFRRAFANHYMSAESLLPWTNDGRFDIQDDMRDFVLVAGEDPYAPYKPMQDLTRPFLRASAKMDGAVFNEVV